MSDPDFDALEQRLRLIQSDHALLNSFKAQHPTLIALLADMLDDLQPVFAGAPCPVLDDVTAIQCTIFDNGEKKSGRASRWGASVKVYTTAPVKNWKKPTWSATVALWSGAVALTKAQALESPKRKNPISHATVEMVRRVAEGGLDLIGIPCHKHPAEGTFFFDQHVLAISLSNEVVSGGFFASPDCMVDLPPFVGTDAGGAPLSGRAVAMSRYSDRDELASWATAV